MEKSKTKLMIHKYNILIFLNIISYFTYLGLGTILKGFFPFIHENPSFQLAIRLVQVYLCIIYLILIIYFYKTCRILNSIGKLKTHPILITIITVLTVPFLFLINLVIIFIIRHRANEYLKENQEISPELEENVSPFKNPAIVMLLNLIVPGIGQLILGQRKKGILFMVLFFLAPVSFLRPATLSLCAALILALYIISSVDSYKIAVKLKNRNQVGEWDFF